MDVNHHRPNQMPPPDSVIPNFDHPRDAGRKLIIAGLTICVAFVTVFFLIRCYVKLVVNQRFILADWFCVVAWVLVLFYASTLFAMVHYGLGYHAWEITSYNHLQTLKWLYASSIIYIPAAYFVKVTLLLLIARVFAVEARVARGIRVFIWLLLLAYTPIQLVKIIICSPISAYWDPTVPHSRCFNQRKVFISDLAIAVVADLAILLLPIPLTWSLRLPLRKKIKIILLLGAGGVATAVTIYRLVKIVQFLDAYDVTAGFVIVGLTTYIELTIGFVCACLPSLNLLCERYASRRRARKGEVLAQRARETRWPRPRPSVGSVTTAKENRKINYWWDMLNKPYTRSSRGTSTFDRRTTHRETVLAAPNTATGGTSCGDGDNGSVGVGAGDGDGSSGMVMMTFDRELAMFTGKALPESEDRQQTVEEARGGIRRINSLDGRREGWLAPKMEGEGPESGVACGTVQAARVGGGCLDMGDLEGGPDVGYWGRIWDGTRDDTSR